MAHGYNNFMNNKDFHPANFTNQKRVSVAHSTKCDICHVIQIPSKADFREGIANIDTIRMCHRPRSIYKRVPHIQHTIVSQIIMKRP